MDFIETERTGNHGEKAEMAVWEALKLAFRGREGVAYRHFPIFARTGEAGTRKEPDILIIDRELGVLVIEVKGLRCEQIERINGHRWYYRYSYEPSGSPYQQAENQLFALFGYTDREPSLRRRVDGRAVVALPWIHSEEWLDRGLDQGPNSPAILFEDNLSPASFLATLRRADFAQRGKPLDAETFDLLLQSVSGSTGYRRSAPTAREEAGDTSSENVKGTRGDVIKKARDHLHRFDLQQELVAKQIAPGPQRIRGIAGSGKTVLLCQKAVQMHLKHPDWDIGLIFFTRSLYDLIIGTVDRWMRRFSQGELSYDPNNSKLQVLHAWGAREQPGFYRKLALAASQRPLTARDAPGGLSPTESYAWALKSFIDALEKASTPIPRLFDALLVDEGQDLIFDERFLTGDRQPFYWLAYTSLRPARAAEKAQALFAELDSEPTEQDLRRLVWAYDEAQSLDALTVPTYKEVFGADVATKMSASGPRYPGGISKNEVMGRCYRTPGRTLAAAHAIGMGLLRPGGMLYGVTTKQNWNVLGYDVEGEFRSGRHITLERRPDATPNVVPSLTDEEVLTFTTFPTRAEEIAWVADSVVRDLRSGDIEPSRDILLLALGNAISASRIQKELAQALSARGIDYYIPSATVANVLSPKYPDKDPNAFWHEGAVTVATLHRAKGNEADIVYTIGLDEVAKHEESSRYRNQVFVALTRSRGYSHLSGVGSHPFFSEVREVLASGTRLSFIFRKPERQFDEAYEEAADDKLPLPADASLGTTGPAIGRDSRTKMVRTGEQG